MEEVTERRPPDVLTSDTENATTIPVKDAPPEKQQKFRRFRAYNRGLWNGPKRENKEEIRRQDNLHVFDALSSQLELTQYQKARGRETLDDLHLKSFGKSVEHVIFGICVLVVNRDVEDGYRYWPHPQVKQNDAVFKDVADGLGLDLGDQLSVVQQVAYRIGEFTDDSMEVHSVVRPRDIETFFD